MFYEISCIICAIYAFLSNEMGNFFETVCPIWQTLPSHLKNHFIFVTTNNFYAQNSGHMATAIFAIKDGKHTANVRCFLAFVGRLSKDGWKIWVSVLPKVVEKSIYEYILAWKINVDGTYSWSGWEVNIRIYIDMEDMLMWLTAEYVKDWLVTEKPK